MDHNFFVPAYGRWATISLRLCAFTREKKKKNKSRKVGKAQRQSAAAESHTEWTTISLRLPTAGRALRLCEKKEKKRIGRPVILRGRPQRVRRGGQVDRFFFVCKSLGEKFVPM
jgi:hypothetical protein